MPFKKAATPGHLDFPEIPLWPHTSYAALRSRVAARLRDPLSHLARQDVP